MINYISFEVAFHNLPVHSPQQLLAFQDRLMEMCKTLHPERGYENDITVEIERYTLIHPEVMAEPMATSHAEA